MKRLFYLLTCIVTTFIVSCSDQKNENNIQKNVAINSLEHDETKYRLFILIDSVGYEVDSVENIELSDEISIQRLNSRLFDGSLNKAIYKSKLLSAKLYYISQINSLTSDENKEMEVFRGTLLLTELTYESVQEIKKMEKNYDTLLNLTAKYGYLSKTFYDYDNHRMWHVIDKSRRATSQFQELIIVFDLLTNKKK